MRIRFADLLGDIGNHSLPQLDLREIQLATFLDIKPAVIAVVQQPPPLLVRRCNDDVTMRVSVGVFPEPKSNHGLAGVALMPTAAMHAPLQAIKKVHQRTLPDFDGDGIAEIEGRVDIRIDRGEKVAILGSRASRVSMEFLLQNVLSAMAPH